MSREDLRRALSDDLKPIARELAERLDAIDVSLPEEAVVAIEAAFGKAMYGAANRGIVEAAAQIADQAPELEFDAIDGLTLPPFDPWQERYGDGS
jgi:hypothetical protein